MYRDVCIIIKSPSICNFLDIDECEGNHSCHKGLPAQTPWDHMSVSVSLYILKMDKAAQVVVRFPLK